MRRQGHYVRFIVPFFRGTKEDGRYKKIQNARKQREEGKRVIIKVNNARKSREEEV
jgi:hypothetical protein